MGYRKPIVSYNKGKNFIVRYSWGWDDISYWVDARTRMESYLVNRVVTCSRDDITVYTVPRGYNGRILSYSPYSFRESTSSWTNISAHYSYSNLSRKLHSASTERNWLQGEIEKYIPNSNQYFHLFLEDVETYEKYREYCDRKSLPVMKKVTYFRVQKLMKKWRILSGSEHYKLTKQEKRKLKKLARLPKST